ncbi:MAG: Lrp/AsnC family transcriptional regulator [Planctomycetes bacterium]|nr:Lrp/AsnC family transcriptional regulator [Planctomycetota bacterium]MCD7896917.1 Lrp/AsnC family transcriptional regulator [Planctomycetaceae bacterium]
MDDLDVRLLNALQKNSRASLKEIATQVCLSIPATSERLRKLERAGIITGYSVIVDNEKLGRPFLCFCFLTLGAHDSHRAESFLEFIRSEPDILECHRITGGHEYLVKIATRSPRELEELLVRMRDDFGVIKTDTHTILSSLKSSAAAPAIAPKG